MKALDTNVVVRFLVNDDAGQSAAVKDLFQKAEKEGTSFFISILVLLEALWVLTTVYRCASENILVSLEQFLLMQVLEFERPDLVRRVIKVGRLGVLDLGDALMGLYVKELGHEVTLTFDKKAAKSEIFEAVK